MKIRTDFVTNSSSSNYSVQIRIESSNASVEIEEDPNGDDGFWNVH